MSAIPVTRDGPRYGMVVDLNRCVGCQTCTIACKHQNDTSPGVQWRQVLDVELGTFPDVERLFLVVGCQHCAEPPCVPVCPTGATFQRDDGLVAMDYDQCIGCGYCAVSCPYQARTIVHDPRWYFGRATAQEEAVAHPERTGVAQKCTFCVEKIDSANGRVPGVDLDVTPACAASCIAQAIRFGDLADADSQVSGLVRDNSAFQMHAELGTGPQIHYLYETPAVPGREAGPAEAQTDPALTGRRQTFWDLRAAANFTFGGFGSGLAVMSGVAYLLGGLSADGAARVQLVASAIIALGLVAVFLEIGRKERFWRAVLRPRTSWMTREIYAVAVLFPAIAIGALSPGGGTITTAAIAAAAFLYCQGRILHAAKGIPAWRVPDMPTMLVASGLQEGAALLALASLLGGPEWLRVIAGAAGAAFALVNAVLWSRYRHEARANGIAPAAREEIERIGTLVFVLGHLLAGVAFAALAIGPDKGEPFAVVAGAGTLLAGALWKATIIVRAAYQQGYALPMVPGRGSGERAAPRRS